MIKLLLHLTMLTSAICTMADLHVAVPVISTLHMQSGACPSLVKKPSRAKVLPVVLDLDLAQAHGAKRRRCDPSSARDARRARNCLDAALDKWPVITSCAADVQAGL